MNEFKVGDLVRIRENFRTLTTKDIIKIEKLGVPCRRDNKWITGHKVRWGNRFDAVGILGEDRLEHIPEPRTFSESHSQLQAQCPNELKPGPGPESEFKVGDRLEVIDAFGIHQRMFKVGNVLTVAEIRNKLFKDKGDGICFEGIRGCFLVNRFRRVELESESEPEQEFTNVPDYITRTVESASFPQAMWRLTE